MVKASKAWAAVVWAWVLLALVVAFPAAVSQAGPLPQAVGWPFKGASITGYTADAFNPAGNAYLLVDSLQDLGVNSISLVVNWYQSDAASTAIGPHPALTVNDQDLINLIHYVHRQGMSVMLKPHLEVLTGTWRGEIQPSDANAWFASYAEFMRHYAAIAAQTGVELLCIGTEQQSMTAPEVVQGWNAVIDAVRAVYGGALTYAGAVGEIDGTRRPPIPIWFWDRLDYAAITVYLRLTDDPTPSVEVLTAQWQGWVMNMLTGWQATHGKPVLFAEIGYRSVSATAMSPWLTRGHNYVSDPATGQSAVGVMAYDGAGQANAYQAFFASMAPQSWMAGAFLWQFEASPACQVSPAGEGSIGYSVFGKPAGQVVHQWYGGRGAAPSVYPADRSNPVIDYFEYTNDQAAGWAWRVQTSGTVTLNADTNAHAPNDTSTASLRITSSIPSDPARYMQLVFTPCTGLQDWSAGRGIGFWIYLQSPHPEVQGVEVTVGLVDGGEEQPEVWQYSRWVPITGGWQYLYFPLQANPALLSSWEGAFTVPAFRRDPPTNWQFELNNIWQVWLTIQTTTEDAQRGLTDVVAWVDDLLILYEEPVIPTPPPTVAPGCTLTLTGYTPRDGICDAHLQVTCQGIPNGTWGNACVGHPGLAQPDCNYPAMLGGTDWVGFVTLGGTGANAQHWATVIFAGVQSNVLQLACP